MAGKSRMQVRTEKKIDVLNGQIAEATALMETYAGIVEQATQNIALLTELMEADGGEEDTETDTEGAVDV